MKLSVGLLIVLATTGAISLTHAQSIVAPDAGTLGQREVATGFTLEQLRGFAGAERVAGVGIKMPISRHLDVSIGYSRAWANFGIFDSLFAIRSSAQQLSTSATAYAQWKMIKPFVSLYVGSQWYRQSLDFGGLQAYSERDRVGVWGTEIGVQIPARWFAVIPSISYNDAFLSHSIGVYDYGLFVQRWISQRIGASMGVDYTQDRVDSEQRWTYSTSVAYRF